MSTATITCEDCMDLMQRYPDKHFDLALVDPPYGIGQDWKKRSHRTVKFPETSYKNNAIPPKAYFDELFRVSCHQIIFGYNYFVEILGPTNYLIIWDKCSGNNINFKYSQAEIAFTSMRIPVKVFRVPWDGSRMGSETNSKKIHPHQKPLDLYVQILRSYSKPGFKILDTHMGGGSSVLASLKLGLDITACEIDETYFAAAKKRIDLEAKQMELFLPEETHPDSLFEDFDLLKAPCA